MARTLESYPPMFAQAIDRALADGEFVIPCKASTPQALRQQFFGYFRALRAAGRTESADAVELVTPRDEPPRIILRDRSNSTVALDISDALAAAGTSPSDAAAADSFSRLASLIPRSDA